MNRREPETKHLSGPELRNYLRALREGGGEHTSEVAVHALLGSELPSLSSPAGQRAKRDPALGRTQTGKPAPAATALYAAEEMAVGRPLLGGAAAEEAETSVFARPLLHGSAHAASDQGEKARPKPKPDAFGRFALPRKRVVRAAIACAVGMGALAFVAVQGSAEGGSPQASAEVHPDVAAGHAGVALDHPVGAASAASASAPAARQDLPIQAHLDGGAVAARQAVDLLLSGDTRAALDAYRALVVRAGNTEALAWAVRLLERELSRCPQGVSEPCIQ